jgi:cytochrome c oxidase assembly protein subunit 15
MKKFKRFAFAATVATYFQIFVGGLVRISGAGLGCPDWPTCFGRWFPPTDVTQLPPDIDPAQFNFVLAWIEYVNRLIGMIVGLLIAITAIWALTRMIRYPRIWIPSALAAILVAHLGWQGGQMIEAELDPIMVSIHMGLAFVIACLMVYTTQQAYFAQHGLTPSAGISLSGLRLWVFVLIAISVLQVVLGTSVRAAFEFVALKFPFSPQSTWLSDVRSITNIHTVLGIVVTIAAWVVGARIIRQLSSDSAVVRQITWAVIILATGQALLGVILVMAGWPDLLQIYHLLLSSLFIGILILLLSALRYEGRAA